MSYPCCPKKNVALVVVLNDSYIIYFITGASIFFVLCIVTSCGFMLILLTLLSFVAVHFYKDKQDRNDRHLLDQTFASTTNLTEHQYSNGAENAKAVEVEGAKSSSVFIDRTMNGDVYYSNRNTADHLKNLMLTRGGPHGPHRNNIQYPALVHPSDIGLGRKRPAKPRWRSIRKKHLIPIPEVITETGGDREDISSDIYLNAASNTPHRNRYGTSITHNPLANARNSKGIELVESEPSFERYLHPELIDEAQYQRRQPDTEGCLKSSNSIDVYNYNLSSECVTSCLQSDAYSTHNNLKLVLDECSSYKNNAGKVRYFAMPNLTHRSGHYANNIANTVAKRNETIGDAFVKLPHNHQDEDTYSIDFDDDDDGEEDEDQEGIVSVNNNNKCKVSSMTHATESFTEDTKIDRNFNGLKLNCSNEVKQYRKAESCTHKITETGVVSGLTVHYNKYHPGYSTVGHIKHKIIGSQAEKKRSQSCPNSPILGSRDMYADVPTVTYIRACPALNVSLQTHESILTIEDDLNLSKYINNEWEMRTTF